MALHKSRTVSASVSEVAVHDVVFDHKEPLARQRRRTKEKKKMRALIPLWRKQGACVIPPMRARTVGGRGKGGGGGGGGGGGVKKL